MLQAMQAESTPPHARPIPAHIAVAGALGGLLISAVVLFGWGVGSDRLISIDPRFIAMLPATAVGIGTASIAVLLLRNPGQGMHVAVGRALATFIIVLGAFSLGSRIAERELLSVGVLFRDRVAAYPWRPVGVMASNSGVVFIIAGTALLLMSSARPALRRIAQGLCVTALTIAAVALLGHLYGARALFELDRLAGMALLTALGFSSVLTGILFLRPYEGGVSLVTQNDLASRMMRRLVPLTVLVPVLLGLLWLEGRTESLYTRETGVALYVVFSSLWIVTVLLYNARHIRQAEEARTRLLEREQHLRATAESASKTKSDFLGVMSHELRTPLNAIIGYVDLLDSGVAGSVSAEQQKHLARIRSSATHLTRTVGDILTLSRLEAGTGVIRTEPVSLNELLDEVSGILEPLARAKSLVFSCACELPVTVDADAHRLRQILINLGGNAIKFTRSGRVAISVHADGNVARVEVSDTGIGIADGDLERIFDEFWQVEGDLTRTFDGAGLGLAVSRRLARQLGGDITVSSTLGAGSTFTVTLPLSQQSPSTIHALNAALGATDPKTPPLPA